MIELVFIGLWIGALAAVLTSFAMAIGGRSATGESWTSRSHCRCGADLSAVALIPIVGWVVSAGRARCCSERIPWRFPAAEAGAAVLAVLACVLFGAVPALLVAATAAALAGAAEFRRG